MDKIIADYENDLNIGFARDTVLRHARGHIRRLQDKYPGQFEKQIAQLQAWIERKESGR